MATVGVKGLSCFETSREWESTVVGLLVRYTGVMICVGLVITLEQTVSKSRMRRSVKMLDSA